MHEVELKFLNIDVKNIKEKLKEINAKIIYDETIESFPFLADGFDWRDSNKKFLRIRKINDNNIIMTYKSPAKKSNMTSKEEIEIKVDNYDNAILLLEKLWFKKWKKFTKHRTHYEFWNIHFELDTVNNIPTYLEIETQSENAMLDICNKLKLDISLGRKGTIVELLPENFIK